MKEEKQAFNTLRKTDCFKEKLEGSLLFQANSIVKKKVDIQCRTPKIRVNKIAAPFFAWPNKGQRINNNNFVFLENILFENKHALKIMPKSSLVPPKMAVAK